MAPRLRPCLGLAGWAPLDLFPQHLRLWQGGLCLSLLRSGLSWRLGFGTRSASQVGGALASLPTPLLLSACSGHAGRGAGAACPAVSPRLAAAGACLLGVSGGAGVWSRTVGLSWTHPPLDTVSFLSSLFLQHPHKDASRRSGSTFSPHTSSPRHLAAPLTSIN